MIREARERSEEIGRENLVFMPNPKIWLFGVTWSNLDFKN